MGLIETTKERGDKNNEDCGKTERAMQTMADGSGIGLGDGDRKEQWGGSGFS